MATLTRSQLASLLGSRAGGALRGVGLTTADTTGNLKEPLDDTLRTFGVTYGDEIAGTLDSADVTRFVAVGRVFVLRRALDEAMGFADVAATQLGVSKSKSQIVKHLRDALADAESAAAQYGIPDLMPVMGSGVYIIDAIEPENVA